MERIFNLEDLLVEQLRDRYDAAIQQVKTLEKILEHTLSPQLTEVFANCLEYTREHVARLSEILKSLSKVATGETCEGTEGLIREAWELFDRSVDTPVREAGLVTSLQHINHHDIAGYGTCCAYARALQKEVLASELHQMLEEVKSTDQALSKLAEQTINKQAKAAVINY